MPADPGPLPPSRQAPARCRGLPWSWRVTRDDRTAPLSDRELEALRAARTGASVNQIATQAHPAPGTVRTYLSSAAMPAGVSPRHAATRRAWEPGWT
jgi:two-component system, NarL family, response regulator DesR